MSPRILITMTVAFAVAGLSGCATAKKDTTGFAVQQEVVLEESYADAWQHVKRTLLANEYEVYTRDKRGTFVAYKGGKSFLGVLNSPRQKYTVDLEPVSNGQTKVSVEVVKQVYGVSLTTYPDWHDRQTKGDDSVRELIGALTGAPAEASTPVEEAPAEEASTTDATPVEEAAPVEAAPVEETTQQ